MRMYDLAVVGLGYVGLPLAVTAAESGMAVVGIDSDRDRVDDLVQFRSPTPDISSERLEEVLQARLDATTDEAVLGRSEAIVVCVPTPINDDGMPDLGAVRSAAEMIARNLQYGAIVVLESTTYPGTTEEFFKPILERSGLRAGEDFLLAYSPERIDPGNKFYSVKNTPKVVGGLDSRSSDAAAALYGRFIDTIVRARSTREAELCKLLENTYRHVNIALINEFAKICHALGIDIWNTIDCAASKPFGFQAFAPGAGVGGHCIPIDPHYLNYDVRRRLGYPLRFVELAQEINATMPGYTVRRAQDILNCAAKPLKGSRIMLLGITYKRNVPDLRMTPAEPIVRHLRELGAIVSYSDPYVKRWAVDGSEVTKVDDPVVSAEFMDLVLVLQSHSMYSWDAICKGASLVLDMTGTIEASSSVSRL